MTTKQRAATARQRPERSDHATLKLVTDRAGGDADPVGRADPQPRAASGPSLMFGVAPFITIARELPPLFEKHWDELENDGFGLELNPDWDLMFDMAQIGRLHVMTARWGADMSRGQLVGYIFNFVLPHVYTKKDLQAQIHLFYLHPSYRDEPGFLLRWFRANDAFLVTLGVKKIYAMTKNNYRDGKAGVIFKRLGYVAVETAWARMVP